MSLNKDDLEELYGIAKKQLIEDRETLQKLYESLSKQVLTPEDFSINGDTLAKFAELLNKQTGQIIELIKTAKPKKENETSFSDTEKDSLYTSIDNQ